ncbi:MAG: N-acetylmuramoyl-L-alanine amidase, partial [Clostridia bacterium]|nr:N-acetylmuramoyl-L-alanine amidase [Clostridia bacterium]
MLASVVCITSILVCQIQFTSSNAIVNENLPTIIIDAGHGGEDGGAVGIDGTYEKDINLQISLKVNEIFSIFGYKTHLIRTTDTAIHTEGHT